MTRPQRTAQIARVGGQSAFFLLGSVFTLLVGLPLQIYIARVIGPDGIGVFTLLQTSTATLAGLLSLGLAPTMVRFFPEYLVKEQFHYIRYLTLGVMVLLGLMGSLGTLAFLTAEKSIVQLWPDLVGQHHVLTLMAMLIPVTMLSFACQQGLRGFQEIRYMVLGSSILQLIVKVIFTVILLGLGFQLTGYVWAIVFSSIFGLVWMAVGLWRQLHKLPSHKESVVSTDALRGPASYAVVMYSGSILGLLMGQLDVYLLAALSGSTAVGILAVVKTLQNLPVTFLQMIITVISPMLAESKARNAREELNFLYHLATDWLLRLSLPLLIFIAIFSAPLLTLYGNDFASEGAVALAVLVIAQTVSIVIGPVGNLLNMVGHERPMLKMGIIQDILTVSALLILVPTFGLTGAALASCLGIMYVNFAALRVAHKRVGIKWWDAKFLRWILPTIITIMIAIAIRFIWQAANSFTLVGTVLLLYASFNGISILRGLHPDDMILWRHVRVKIVAAFSAKYNEC